VEELEPGLPTVMVAVHPATSGNANSVPNKRGCLTQTYRFGGAGTSSAETLSAASLLSSSF